jgi:Uma2 family endonuclease
MTEVAHKRLTFEEFTRLNSEGRYELVDGRLEELVAPRPLHGWTYIEFAAEIVPYLRQHDPGHYRGGEVDVPTIPFHGRRPDFVYYASRIGGVDLTQDTVHRPPTLAVEILSEGDTKRDLVDKPHEYALAGIEHYWIIDPVSRSAVTYVLQGEQYALAGQFGEDDNLVSDLFPGLAIPLARLFPD